MYGSWNATAKADETLGISPGHGHNGSLAQKSAKGDLIAHPLAWHWNQTHCRGLVIDHSNGHFVRNNGRYGGCWSIPGNGNHV